jgi:hypothetical protein
MTKQRYRIANDFNKFGFPLEQHKEERGNNEWLLSHKEIGCVYLTTSAPLVIKLK